MTDGKDSSRSALPGVLVTVAVGLAIAAVYALSRDLFSQEDTATVLRYLSDAFVIPGVLLVGVAGLTFVKRQGIFDGLTFGFRYAFNAILPMFWLNADERRGKLANYGDYCLAKREKERNAPSHIARYLTVGGAFLAIGIVLALVV